MTYCFDIDGTICDKDVEYQEAKAYRSVVAKINSLYDEGHTIILYTARGSKTGLDWTELTNQQVKKWGIKCHEVKLGKPFYDLIIDDRAINADLWRSRLNLRTCLITGVFDLINIELCAQLKRLRKKFNNIVVAIQSDPSLEDKNAKSPKTALEDRITMLKSIRDIDEILVFRVNSDIKHIAPQIQAEIVEPENQKETECI